MEFKEFTNPESKDYDIYNSLKESEPVKNISISNPYVEQLIDLIGFLEDITDEELQEKYGISMQEYFHPTAEVILKVTEKLNNCNNRMYR